MKRYLIPIITILVLASGLLIGCDSVPSSEPTVGQESSSPESQQRISDLEQQIQLLNQQVDSLGESISSLERELETQPATTDSDFEARIEQQIAQLGEQIDKLGEQLDELNAEVVTINQQLTEQEAEEEATSPASVPEAPPGTVFTFSGHGLSSSKPFTVTSTPFEIRWEARLEGKPGTTFVVTVVYPENGTTAESFGWYIEEGITSSQTMCYVQPGTYYLSVNTDLNVSWTIWIIELD